MRSVRVASICSYDSSDVLRRRSTVQFQQVHPASIQRQGRDCKRYERDIDLAHVFTQAGSYFSETWQWLGYSGVLNFLTAIGQ